MKSKTLQVYVDGENVDCLIFIDIDENGNHIIRFHAWHGEALQAEIITVSESNVELLERIIKDFSTVSAEVFYNSFTL